MEYNFSIPNLGKRLIKSPLNISNFTQDKKRLLFNSYSDNYLSSTDKEGQPLSVELAGPVIRYFLIHPKQKRQLLPAVGFVRASMM